MNRQTFHWVGSNEKDVLHSTIQYGGDIKPGVTESLTSHTARVTRGFFFTLSAKLDTHLEPDATSLKYECHILTTCPYIVGITINLTHELSFAAAP